MIISKEHLTEAGLRKIVAIKASMNNGLSLALTSAFADVTPVNRPLVLDKKIKDPAPHTKCGVTDHRPVRGADPN
jgi:hypothetical protein